MISVIVCDRDGYSLDDWTIRLADRSIFVQEVILQEHLFEIGYNSYENSKYDLILKNEKHLYLSLSEKKVTMKSIQRKYFIFKQAT